MGKHKSEIIQYTFLFFSLFIILSWLIHLFFSSIDSWEDYNFSKWEKSLTLGISITGFLALIITLRIFQKSDKRFVQQATLQLFDKFRDTRFTEIRDEVWKVRRRWEIDDEYKDALIKASFRKRQQEQPMPDIDISTVNQEHNKDYTDESLKKDMQKVRDLFEFYCTLLAFADIPEALISYRYFYYSWWRPFLYEIAEIHDENYEFNEKLEAELSTNYKKYIDEMSYVNKLERLDEVFGFKGIDEEFNFHI